MTDAAGGAYAVEKLTDDLAVAAWAELFGRIEEAGWTLGSGDRASTVERRDREVATRRRPLTGLSEFPNLAEALPERSPAPGGDAVRRYGAAFEALRDDPAAEPCLPRHHGLRRRAHRARDVRRQPARRRRHRRRRRRTERDADDLVAAYDGQRVVCLAGSDGAYDDLGRRGGRGAAPGRRDWVVIAGKPRDSVDDSAAMGVDALDFLHRTREQLA